MRRPPILCHPCPHLILTPYYILGLGRSDALRIELRLLREDIHRITLELRERALKVHVCFCLGL